MSKESETNREGFGSPATRKKGGEDPEAAKYRATTLSKQGGADGQGVAGETQVDESGRANGETLARQGRESPEKKDRR